ncbi:hypothetical protein [Arcobacter cloacae]|uniref:Uncharacterized protein n=1 Tax=Arcobacter cloacae TaxID=1054034 RepID=A0A6M8NV07_9BACT|nr:hypothetical protein [Arcobacter cloacae]QKF90426.1 hypothetical protein ACLO_1945 [Arcobacter cloacae]RXI37350.1 hypothetical protein CP963_12995 [Arcobacter cloacae]
MNAEQLIGKLMSYYNVFSMHELSSKIGISQPAISKWKNNNSILAIKKKCRELGIYDEIFGNLNKIIDIASEVNQAAKEINEVDIDETTLLLFKEAYQKAKNSDNIKGLRVYLMDFDQQIKPIDTITLNDFKNILDETLKNSKKN